MRTKSLLLAAALLGIAGASAMAQVYSVNAVGFVNVTLPANKFKLVANPLNSSDNKLSNLFKNVPNGTAFYKFGTGGYEIAGFNNGWDLDLPLNPGEGGWIKVPAGSDVVVTFVGEVPQSTAGPLVMELRQGFQIISSIVPQKLPLTGAAPDGMDFPAANGDTVYFFRNNAYEICSYFGTSWDTVPVPEVGEAFWVRKAGPATWSRTFTVN